MKYRKLTAEGDYTFGKGASNFIQNTPETVGQAVATRLKLMQGEWFLDNTEGCPYSSQILGMGRLSTYNAALQDTILRTPNVTGIASYSSGVDPKTRLATVNCTINTAYGTTTLTAVI